MLLGDGSGKFSPVGPNESGLVVPGDARSLAHVDLNGDRWPDFVIGNNDFVDSGVCQTQWATTSGASPLLVKLSGHSGNPTAVGAKVTVNFGGGIITDGGGFCWIGLPDPEPRNINLYGKNRSHSYLGFVAKRNHVDSGGP